MINKRLAIFALAASLLPLGDAAYADYPERTIQATVAWGAGGLTDVVARSVMPHAEKALGTSIVVNNRPGGTTVIGVTYVKGQRPDGYNILVGTQDTTLLPVLGVADFDYKDFTPINIMGQGLAVIAVNPDSPWDSMEELVAAVKAEPNTLRMGDVGPGATPHITHTIVDSSVDFDFDVRKVTFGGDGPGITALLGNHIDFMPLSLAPAMEQIKAGRLKPLAVLSEERIDVLPDVPAITEALPKAAEYLPWGSFQGIFVRKDTPDEIKATLSDAFEKAVATSAFKQKYTQQFGGVVLNLRGKEAQDYIDHWQSVTSWLLEDTGEAKVSPKTLGIPRP